jgi:sec-independent protein translocase protein TatA
LTGSEVRGTFPGDRLVRMESIMFGLGAWELFIILAIVVVLFGARRLPEIGSGMGKAIKNFKSGMSGKDEIDVTPEKDEINEGKSQS